MENPRHHHTYKAIFDRIATAVQTLPAHRARILGVNGVDTAGKTVFATALAHALESRGMAITLIHLDDFHNPRAVRYQEEDPVASYIHHAFNLTQLARELLAPARRGQTVNITLTHLNLETDTCDNSRHYTITQDTCVIVEGVLLYRPPIDPYFDFRIFLDIPFAEVLRRAEARDVPRYGPAFLDRYRTKYIPIQQWYIAHHHPRTRSDMLIDNTDVHHPKTLKVVENTHL